MVTRQSAKRNPEVTRARILAAAGRLAMTLAQGKGSTLGRASLGGMTVVCLVFVGLCVKSFIDVRKAREAREQAGGE